MIYVQHGKEIPEHVWFKSDVIHRKQQWVWAVIMDGKIYSTWIYKQDAEKEAEELVRYFS